MVGSKIGRFTKKIRMVALLMTEILNFTTIEENTSSRSMSYKKFHKKDNMTGRVIILFFL